MTEKTGMQLMGEATTVTLLDADLNRIMGMVDTYAAYSLGAARWGNEHGDEDGARAHRRLVEDAIRALVNKALGR